MSKVAAPEHTLSLKEANAQAEAAAKSRKGIDKRVTTFKGDTAAAKDGEGTAGTGAIDLAPMAPNDEQLEKINKFTRSNKTADDLVVFPTLSCNDLYDRDDERFVTDTVKGFAKLEEPYGPVGKSYMVGHDYSKLPVGRIFDVGTKTVDLGTLSSKGVDGATIDSTSKSTFLTNWVYVPKTSANQQFIENLDFGVNWAVSVGVMLEEAKCSLSWCNAPMRSFGRWAWCQEGHDKGYFYTEDAEEDSWGYAIPCDPTDKGAEKCRTDLYGAKDFYELSQVFLGAQFFAALDGAAGKSAKGILKAASARAIPIVGLSAKEAEMFEKVMPHLPERAVKGMRDHGARPDEEGTLKWTDEQNLVWTFTPGEDTEVLCLGKATDDDEDGEEDDEDGKSAEEQPEQDAHGEGSGEQSQDGADASADDGEGDGAEDGGSGTGEVQEGVGEDGGVADKAAGHTHSHTHSDIGTTHSHQHTHSGDNAYQHTSSDNVTHAHSHSSGKEASVSKAAIIESLKGLGVPESVLQAVESAKGSSLDTALRPLAEKATLGDQFIQTKRADAIAWYVKANQTEPNVAVSTDTFQRLLDAAGDNVELIDALTEQQKNLAQAKFPKTARRSSFPADANKATPPTPPALPDEASSDGGSRTVKRLHG